MTGRNSSVTTTLLARRTRALKRHLDAAAAGDPRGIHQARVASRRLREAVPVLSAGLTGCRAGKTRKRMRRLTMALGAVRELDVTLALLDELVGRETLSRLALEEVRTHVIKERDPRVAGVTERLVHARVSRINRRLASLREALEEADSDRWRHALASRLMRRAKRLDDAIGHAGQMYEPERLHRVRLAVKKLRYTLELAADAGIADAAISVRILKRVQDLLGRLHDLQILQARIAAIQANPQAARVPRGEFESITASVEEECRHLHARYVTSVPSVMASLDRTRNSVLAQLVPSGIRKPRTVKMDLTSARRRSGNRGPLRAAAQKA